MDILKKTLLPHIPWFFSLGLHWIRNMAMIFAWQVWRSICIDVHILSIMKYRRFIVISLYFEIKFELQRWKEVSNNAGEKTKQAEMSESMVLYNTVKIGSSLVWRPLRHIISQMEGSYADWCKFCCVFWIRSAQEYTDVLACFPIAIPSDLLAPLLMHHGTTGSSFGTQCLS
jgi:hypothetical protein